MSVLCSGSRESKIRAAFELYDINNDGFISLNEMTKYMKSVFWSLKSSRKLARSSGLSDIVIKLAIENERLRHASSDLTILI